MRQRLCAKTRTRVGIRLSLRQEALVRRMQEKWEMRAVKAKFALCYLLRSLSATSSEPA